MQYNLDLFESITSHLKTKLIGKRLLSYKYGSEYIDFPLSIIDLELNLNYIVLTCKDMKGNEIKLEVTQHDTLILQG